MVSPWNVKIFTQGSRFSWVSLSKEDMTESNVLWTAWARVAKSWRRKIHGSTVHWFERVKIVEPNKYG